MAASAVFGPAARGGSIVTVPFDWLRRFALLSVVIAFLAGSVAPAMAEKISWHDSTGDMWTGEFVNDEPVWNEVVPTHANGDFRRIHVNHADRAVIIRATYRNLRRRGRFLTLSGDVKTNTGYVNGFYIAVGPDGDVGWNDPPRLELDYTCVPKAKIGPSIVDYRLNVMEVKIPRACLRHPRWVKVRVHTTHLGLKQGFRDDGLSAKGESRRWTKRIRHD